MTNTIYTIQLLRGFAALLVLVTHVRLETGFAPYGAAGVDLFFIISGFVIYFVTEHDKSNFLLKRVIRVVPLYWLATFFVAGVAIAAPALLKNAELTAEHLILSLLFIPHWTDAQEFQPLLALGWTLNFEMMFYILFAAAMSISHKWRLEIAAALVVCIMTIGSAFSSNETPIGFEFYGSSLMLEFIAGMLIAKGFTKGKIPSAGPWAFILLVPVFLFVIAFEHFDIRAIDFGIISALLLCATLSAEKAFAKAAWRRRLAVIAGEISYSLYLLHIYVLAVLSRLVGLDGIALWIASFTLIPLGAWITFQVVERQATRALRKVLLPRKMERPEQATA